MIMNKKVLIIISIIVGISVFYLTYSLVPRYSFFSSEGIAITKCHKVTGKCSLTELGENLRENYNK
jgi:hypothetical protein